VRKVSGSVNGGGHILASRMAAETKMSQALDERFSPGKVRRDADTLAAWGCDWTRAYIPAPSAVVFPESVEDVVELVRLANADGLALVPSGGRTGLSGGAVAGAGEVVVSF